MNKERYAYIKFKNNSHLYIYKCGSDFKIGDVVEAPTCNYMLKDVGLIVKIKKLELKALPIEYDRILTITNKLDKKENEKFFYPMRFIKKRINRNMLKEWRGFYKNCWLKSYHSNFGGCVTYEKDGVLTVSYNKVTDENYFEEYTLTSIKNYKTKVKFMKTILSELFYSRITKDEFYELMSMI